MTEPIFHLALSADWEAARRTPAYTMSTRGMTLDEVGYIHCSQPSQMEGVANRYYADVDELLVLTVDPNALGTDVVWEPPAPGVDDLYPHIYGPLPVTAVTASRRWPRGVHGWSLNDLD